MASPSFSSSSSSISHDENHRQEVLKEAVYHKIGNIYFRKSIENAKTFEEKKLEAAKARLQKLNAA